MGNAVFEPFHRRRRRNHNYQSVSRPSAVQLKMWCFRSKSFLKLCQRAIFFAALFILVGIFLLQVRFWCLTDFPNQNSMV